MVSSPSPPLARWDESQREHSAGTLGFLDGSKGRDDVRIQVTHKYEAARSFFASLSHLSIPSNRVVQQPINNHHPVHPALITFVGKPAGEYPRPEQAKDPGRPDGFNRVLIQSANVVAEGLPERAHQVIVVLVPDPSVLHVKLAHQVL
jgi:hypothetical protein